MKKLILYSLIVLIAVSCTDQLLRPSEDVSLEEMVTNRCAAMTQHEAELSADPRLRAKMDQIEHHTQEFIRNRKNSRIALSGKIEIPVVVNVLYKTSAQNISQAQIESQIAVLNEDFNKTNADASLIPAIFSGVAADIDIQFVLEAVNRKSSSKTTWSVVTNDMKKSSLGGIDPTNPAQFLNIWVVNQFVDANSLLIGHAQLPGGNPATDGVVMRSIYFGRTGTATAPFNKGRNTTHEVGHYLNLKHIWGENNINCSSDLVDDTPTHFFPNTQCPTFPRIGQCSGTSVEMTMNFMDYTDDACMYMFTEGQKERMLANFAPGGPRYAMAPIDAPHHISNSGNYPWTFYWHAPIYTGAGPLVGYEVKHTRYDYQGNPNVSSTTLQTATNYVLPYVHGQYPGQSVIISVRAKYTNGSVSGWLSYNCTL